LITGGNDAPSATPFAEGDKNATILPSLDSEGDSAIAENASPPYPTLASVDTPFTKSRT
jgi:hypothetical protein